MLIERGAQLETNALVVEAEDRSALQAAVEDLRAALARLEALPRRVKLDAVGKAIKAVRDAMRQQYAGADLTPAAREEIRRQAGEAERLVEARLRYLEAVGSNPQTTLAMLEGLRDAVRRFEQPADDPLAAAAAQLEDTPAPEETADAAPTPDEAGGAPELPATQLEDEVPDEGRSGRLLGALRDEVVAFLRAVRAGTLGAGGTQLARLRTRALAFPSGPLQASLLDALALARVLGKHEKDNTERQQWRGERDDELVDGQQQSAEPAEDAGRRLLRGAEGQREENAAQAAHELLLTLVFGHRHRDEQEDNKQYDPVEDKHFPERLLDVEAPVEGSRLV